MSQNILQGNFHKICCCTVWFYRYNDLLSNNKVCCFLLLGIRFMDIIRSEAGQPLREELAKSPDKIIAHAFPQVIQKPDDPVNSAGMSSVTSSNDTLVSTGTDNFVGVQSTAVTAGQMPDAHFQGISLVSALVKLMPDWLYNNRHVFDALVLVWKSSSRQGRVRNERSLSLEQVCCIYFLCF
jgi:transformation/transcription domain-associated protein